MVSRVEKSGVGTLSASESQELPLLYRSAASSLSVARNIALDRNLLLYLENLTLRAYLVVYGPRTGVARNLAEFLAHGFPAAVRGMRRHLAIAFAVLAAGAIAGYSLVASDISYYDLLVPSFLAGGRGPDSTADELRKVLFAPWPGFVETFIVFANFLFRHNAMVGIFCFGLGVALGAPTILLLAYNGAALGAFFALHARAGLAADLAGWVAVHGVTEILALLLCASAGLVISEKILFPGPESRLESLARHGRVAAGVASGAVGMFFMAGVFEGGFRQLISNTPGRFAFESATAVFWAAYFIFAGRGKER
jgi:uncharacterized membrane protein SpoIIM required for sporulation